MTNEGIEGIAGLKIPTGRNEVREMSRRDGKGQRSSEERTDEMKDVDSASSRAYDGKKGS